MNNLFMLKVKGQCVHYYFSICSSCTGKPNPATFRSHPMGRLRDSYNITWAVNSYTPIEEFKLYFRKLPSSSAPPVPGLLSSQAHQNNVYKRPTRRVGLSICDHIYKYVNIAKRNCWFSFVTYIRFTTTNK